MTLTIENHGQDGFVHLTYFDKTYLLSFVFDDEHDDLIAVSRGGYGEGVVDTFPWDGSTEDGRASLSSWFGYFKEACVEYIRQNFGEEAIVFSFRRGLQGLPLVTNGHVFAEEKDDPRWVAYNFGLDVAGNR